MIPLEIIYLFMACMASSMSMAFRARERPIPTDRVSVPLLLSIAVGMLWPFALAVLGGAAIRSWLDRAVQWLRTPDSEKP